MNSYTLEASFAGSDQGTNKGLHFTSTDLEEMGSSICKSLLKYLHLRKSAEQVESVVQNIADFYGCTDRQQDLEDAENADSSSDEVSSAYRDQIIEVKIFASEIAHSASATSGQCSQISANDLTKTFVQNIEEPAETFRARNKLRKFSKKASKSSSQPPSDSEDTPVDTFVSVPTLVNAPSRVSF